MRVLLIYCSVLNIAQVATKFNELLNILSMYSCLEFQLDYKVTYVQAAYKQTERTYAACVYERVCIIL